MLITAGGIVIRMNVTDISVYGRSSQGVKLMSTGEEDQVVFLGLWNRRTNKIADIRKAPVAGNVIKLSSNLTKSSLFIF